ncbi:hypothetical protein MMC31_001714 [Peltigera leucophlebia]|nr:hypothetical protein [Peltigera leucophlebia]
MAEPNVLQFNQGAQILEELLAMQVSMEEMRRTIEARFAAVETQLISISTSSRIDEANLLARTYNSKISRADTALRPLVKSDGTHVQHFPLDAARLTALNSTILDGILVAFNLPTNGSVYDRQQRFRVFIGLANMA